MQPKNKYYWCVLVPTALPLLLDVDILDVDFSHYSLSTSPKSLMTSLSVIRNSVILMNCSLKNSRHFTTPPLKWNRSFCKRAEKSNVEWRSWQNTHVIALSTQAFCHPLLSAVVLHKLTLAENFLHLILIRSTFPIWVVAHYQYGNLFTCYSDAVFQGNQWCCHEMSAFFSGYVNRCSLPM